MGHLFENFVQTVGRTQLVRINRIISSPARVYAKLEFRNPLASVKDRIGMSMIADGEKRGLITKDTLIIEPTSGNTGIALAFVCAAKGYKLRLTMPESMSVERRSVLRHLGADIVLTPAAEGMPGAVRAAEKLAAETKNAFIPQQFKNPANPQVHRETTAEEIWADTDGAADVLISGVGTGGTITGVGEVIKERKPGFKCVAVEPVASPVISQTLAGDPLQPGKHRIQGIGAGFIPETLNINIVDDVVQVTDEEAFGWAKRAAREEGILCGISSGAALCAADRIAKKPAYRDKMIVVILPSAGERYLSTPLFEGEA
jgi:cysteine synthase A